MDCPQARLQESSSPQSGCSPELAAATHRLTAQAEPEVPGEVPAQMAAPERTEPAEQASISPRPLRPAAPVPVVRLRCATLRTHRAAKPRYQRAAAMESTIRMASSSATTETRCLETGAMGRAKSNPTGPSPGYQAGPLHAKGRLRRRRRRPWRGLRRRQHRQRRRLQFHLHGSGSRISVYSRTTLHPYLPVWQQAHRGGREVRRRQQQQRRWLQQQLSGRSWVGMSAAGCAVQAGP